MKKRHLKSLMALLPMCLLSAQQVWAFGEAEPNQDISQQLQVVEPAQTLPPVDETVPAETSTPVDETAPAEASTPVDETAPAEISTPVDISALTGEPVYWDETWTWASNSAIHTGAATLYRAPEGEGFPARKNFVVCVNAGHGTQGGSDVQTLSHPDGTPKVTGGTNAEGAVYSIAVSTGMTFLDGTLERDVNLMVAMPLKELLLRDGYDVLMIRESEDVQLDNIARTVLANHNANIHIAIHFDSSETEKGAFYCSVPDDASYKAMEPVASHWEEHGVLGRALIDGLQESGYAIWGDGTLPMDLTQTSYSTIPSVDIELGDAASDHSQEACTKYAQGLKKGIDLYLQQIGL